MAATGADLAQSAAAAEQTQPGMGQKVYQQGLTMMGPSLAASFPSEYNEQTHLILTKTALSNYTDEELRHSGWIKVSPITLAGWRDDE